MAKYLLANTVTVGNTTLRAAKEFDDAFDDIALVQAAGGVLIHLPNAVAEAHAINLRTAQAAGRSDWEASAGVLMSIAAAVPAGRPSLAWYPPSEAAPGRVTKWEDVEEFVEQYKGNCDIWIAGVVGSTEYRIPSTARLNGYGSTDWHQAATSLNASTNIVVEPGAIIRNVRQVYCYFDCGVTGTQSPFVLDQPGASMQVREGGTIGCQVGSLSAPVNAKAFFNQVVFYYAGQVFSAEPTVPAIYVDPGLFFIFAIVVMIGTATLQANTIGGDATTTIITITDANIECVPQPLLLSPFSVQRQTSQAALRPSASNTAGRPTFDLQIGQHHFDTDLGFGIDWNGTDWVDSAGNVV